ncbi:unnamed protein product [Pleuronectes platessa]|uniref:Uncharacterized protein n=1 Tax=Pleuronectes platessa TaxID=8262 RepID=A0A9N7VLT3_PLEPL|nr:unnamed protein product [Pleuronectes platessa]
MQPPGRRVRRVITHRIKSAVLGHHPWRFARASPIPLFCLTATLFSKNTELLRVPSRTFTRKTIRGAYRIREATSYRPRVPSRTRTTKRKRKTKDNRSLAAARRHSARRAARSNRSSVASSRLRQGRAVEEAEQQRGEREPGRYTSHHGRVYGEPRFFVNGLQHCAITTLSLSLSGRPCQALMLCKWREESPRKGSRKTCTASYSECAVRGRESHRKRRFGVVQLQDVPAECVYCI